jgi:hypothetical protein
VNERRDGGFEVVLAFAQLIPVSRAAEGADRGEGGICQHLHLRVARDELYPEPGSFRAGAQAVTLDTGRQIVRSGCIPLAIAVQAGIVEGLRPGSRQPARRSDPDMFRQLSAGFALVWSVVPCSSGCSTGSGLWPLVFAGLVARIRALAVMLGWFRLFRVGEALDQEQIAGHSRPLRPPLHRRAERARLGRRAQPRL